MTALVWAAGRGYLDVVQLLLQHGAKVNINDKVSMMSSEDVRT